MKTLTKFKTEKSDDCSQPKTCIKVNNLSASYGSANVIKNVSINFYDKFITAIIGPSGCGKSTLIRCLNRMHEEVPNTTHSGEVILDGENVFNLDPVFVRRTIGMVFQRPNPFPTMSIFQNVTSGLILNGIRSKENLNEIVEQSLQHSALWDEVKDKLHEPATSLSGGQQQRLCIARALAVKPKVLLLDEPCSALDPIATGCIEDLLLTLKKDYTIVIVTHNMQQAGRISDYTGFMLLGELIEFGQTKEIFTVPKDPKTLGYITGRFG